MHAAQINFISAPPDLSLSELLERWPSLADIADSAASAGVRVSVLQAAASAEHLRRNGVGYYGVASHAGESPALRGAGFAKQILNLNVDLVHVHGFGFLEEVAALAALLPNLPILVQDHANGPPRWWRRPRWRRNLAAVSAVTFTARDQARPFESAHLFHPRIKLFAIPECHSRFTPGDRMAARRDTGLYGDPCLLWVGHLNPGKDPLTVLDGVATAARQMPGLQLWCCFGTATLLSQVQRRIVWDASLAGRVHLLGRVSHDRVQQLMRAADLFVSGSHFESAGYALIEALACGVPPVVTDIPSFRELTGDGVFGYLWKRGDARQLARAIASTASVPMVRAAVRAHFDAQLSLHAVGRRWCAAYAQLLEAHTATARSG